MQILLNKIQNNNYIKRTQNYFNNFKTPMGGGKLSPLACDTISFSASRRLNSADMKHAPSEKVCMIAAENAEPARFYLSLIFDKYIKPISCQANSSTKQQRTLFTTKTRIKSPASIREKVVSKYSALTALNFDRLLDIICDEIKNTFNVNKEFDSNTLKSDYKDDIDNLNYILKELSKEYISYYAVNVTAGILRNNGFISLSDLSVYEIEQKYQKIAKIADTKISEDDNLMQLPDSTTSVDGVKKYVNDIVGGRIVVNRNEDVVKIISAIKKAVNDGKLKITSIEHYVPRKDKLPDNSTMSDYSYASESQLNSLAKLAGCQLMTIPSKTGYMGIHVNVDLSNPLFYGYNSKFNGYSGEIQILGRDVEQLKEVEDLCYKLKDRKNAINSVYSDFKKHFYKYYNEKTKDDFNEYTYALYLAQRLNSNKNKSKEFPSIADLGFEGRVNPNLDFNLLRKIKSVGDYKLAINQEEQKKQAGKDNPVISSIKGSILGTFQN